MPLLICERCRQESHMVEQCNYCGKKIDNRCMKSSRRIRKTIRLVICKSCWSNMKKRSAFKNNRNLILEEQTAKITQKA